MVSKGLIEEQKVQDIYNYYLYNIYQMINTLNYKYAWKGAGSGRFCNYGDLDPSDFSRLQNPFLLDYQDNKINLAKDILDNGMFFPFFGGQLLNNIIDPHLYFILQGKHRLFALKTYQKSIKFIEKQFLFIIYPIDIQYYGMKKDINNILKNPLTMYTFNFEDDKIIPITITSYIDSLKIMDDFGSAIGKYFHSLRKKGLIVKGHEYLNDQELFEKFISQPFNLQLKEELL